MSRVVLFFGSFNPIHLGHLSLAKDVLRATENDEVWFIVSPNSPYKRDSESMPALDRFEMVKLALGSNKFLKVSDIEIQKNPDSYTADTLKLLVSEYPSSIFSILMGEDNVINVEKWKDSEYITSNFKIYVYPRKGNSDKTVLSFSYELINSDYIDISASEIRESFMKGDPKTFYLPIGVYDYIKTKKLLSTLAINS